MSSFTLESSNGLERANGSEARCYKGLYGDAGNSYQSIKFSASLYFITYQLLSVKIAGLTLRVISQVTEMFVVF